MFTPRFYAFILSTMLGLAAACSMFPGTGDPLEDSSWELVRLGSQPAIQDRAPTLNFSDGRIRGSAGCNSFQGEYSVSGAKITFRDLAMTLMACPDAQIVMDQEQRFFEALQDVQGYKLTDSQLALVRSNGTELVFSKK